MGQKPSPEKPSRRADRKDRPFTTLRIQHIPAMSPGERQFLKSLGDPKLLPPSEPTEEVLHFATEDEYILYQVKSRRWNLLLDPDLAQLLGLRMMRAERKLTDRFKRRKDPAGTKSEQYFVNHVLKLLTPKGPRGGKRKIPIDNLPAVFQNLSERFSKIQRDGLQLIEPHRQRTWSAKWLLQALKDYYKTTITEAYYDIYLQREGDKLYLPLMNTPWARQQWLSWWHRLPGVTLTHMASLFGMSPAIIQTQHDEIVEHLDTLSAEEQRQQIAEWRKQSVRKATLQYLADRYSCTVHAVESRIKPLKNTRQK